MQEWLNQQYRNTQSNRDGKVEGRGLGAAFWQNFVDEDALNQGAQRSANQRTATRLGENLADLNLSSDATTLDVEGAVITRGRERTNTKENQQFQRSMTAAMAPIQAQLADNAAAREASNALEQQRMTQSNNLALLQLQQNNQNSIRQLEYQKLRDRKADMQYNERMEMLDRKDRRQAMQSLAAGLASLGAAFAM